MGSYTATGPHTIAGGAPLAVDSYSGGLIDFSSQTITLSNATVTITIAAPGVVTWNSHGFIAGTPVAFTTTGALPTGLVANTIYYVTNDGTLTTNTFHVSDTSAHALAGTNTVTTSGSQSGTQTGIPGFSSGFAYLPNSGIIGATNTTFSGAAAGARCIIAGPVNIGGYDPNVVFPGSINCTPSQLVGSTVAIGTPPTNSGACAIKTQVGGNTAGTFVSNGGCSASTVILSFATTAPNGWACNASDLTTPADSMKQTASGTTFVTLTGTMVANDVVAFSCTAF